MKVAQINSVCGSGSTGRIVKEISQLSFSRGIENIVFYGVGSSDYEKAVHFGSDLMVKKHILLTRLHGKHGFYSKRETLELVRKLEEYHPDIIHLHNIHGHYLNVEILFDCIKELDVPVVWTLHDCWAFTGHCAYFDYAGCSKWKTRCFECQSKRNYPKSYVYDRSEELYIKKKEIFTCLNKVEIVTPSKWLADLVRHSFLSLYPVRTIYNGIDTRQFRILSNIDELRKEKGFDGKKVLLAMPGETKRKGIDYLLRLAHNLDEDMILILVGVKKMNVGKMEQIRFVPYISSISELVQWYNMADVFLNFTLEDNFPTVNIEALACGTPIITFQTGGSPEAIDANTGVIVEKGNIEEAVAAIRFLLKQKKETYQKDCRERAKLLFQSEVNYLKYIELYKNMGDK